MILSASFPINMLHTDNHPLAGVIGMADRRLEPDQNFQTSGISINAVAAVSMFSGNPTFT